jgi:hypothetical protein
LQKRAKSLRKPFPLPMSKKIKLFRQISLKFSGKLERQKTNLNNFLIKMLQNLHILELFKVRKIKLKNKRMKLSNKYNNPSTNIWRNNFRNTLNKVGVLNSQSEKSLQLLQDLALLKSQYIIPHKESMLKVKSWKIFNNLFEPLKVTVKIEFLK